MLATEPLLATMSVMAAGTSAWSCSDLKPGGTSTRSARTERWRRIAEIVHRALDAELREDDSRLAVTPASDSSVLVRWRRSCCEPSGIAAAVLAAARRRANEKLGHHRRGRGDGAAGSVRAIRGR